MTSAAPPPTRDLDRTDLVVRGGTLLTLDPHATILPETDLGCAEGRIALIGPSTGNAEVLDARNSLVLPGLIQGHVHLGQTLFRGLAESRRLLPWLRERIWPLEAAHSDETAYWSGLLGAAECLLGGTTTLQDIGIGPGIRGLIKAIDESGIRALVGTCLMDHGDGLPEGLCDDTDNVLAETEELGRQWHGAADGRIQYLLNPRFILSCSDPLWTGIRELGDRHGWAVHTHALEQEEEAAAVLRERGRDEIEYFDEWGLLEREFRIAHGVWLNHEHTGRLRDRPFSVVHCPSSNLKLGSGIADLVFLRNAGIATGIGADGAPCNNDLDALEEIRLAALLQQLKQGPGAFSSLDALRLATSDGAEALGMGDEIGSLEVGKRADLLVLDMGRPELWPMAGSDLHDLVVFGASRASVRHVVVGGRVLVRDGELTGLDLEAIRRGADKAVAEVVARSGILD